MIYKFLISILLLVCALGQIDQSYQLGWLGNLIHGKPDNGINCDINDNICKEFWING